MCVGGHLHQTNGAVSSGTVSLAVAIFSQMLLLIFSRLIFLRIYSGMHSGINFHFQINVGHFHFQINVGHLQGNF